LQKAKQMTFDKVNKEQVLNELKQKIKELENE